MSRILRRRWQAPAIGALLIGAFITALLVPIPTLPDVGRAAVRAEVNERLPGWTLQRLDHSWEGGYTVVTSCAGKQVGFQFVPGHGLRPEDAWIQPSNDFARARLSPLSDHRRYIVWYADPTELAVLSCHDELARNGDLPPREGMLD